jgi:hypothetical protein
MNRKAGHMFAVKRSSQTARPPRRRRERSNSLSDNEPPTIEPTKLPIPAPR